MSNEWQDPQHAREYLERADTIPHRGEGEAALLAETPPGARRVLDLGSGDGRLLGLVLARCPAATGVALDVSPPMLDQLRRRFAGDARVTIVEHDLERALPPLGLFDVVCSSFAIHHVPDDRKRSLYGEIWRLLQPGGMFCNLEHVASPTPALHERFLQEMGCTPGEEDPSNKLLDVWTQLRWLEEIGFQDVDCLWKWRELALLCGRKP